MSVETADSGQTHDGTALSDQDSRDPDGSAVVSRGLHTTMGADALTIKYDAHFASALQSHAETAGPSVVDGCSSDFRSVVLRVPVARESTCAPAPPAPTPKRAPQSGAPRQSATTASGSETGEEHSFLNETFLSEYLMSLLQPDVTTAMTEEFSAHAWSDVRTPVNAQSTSVETSDDLMSSSAPVSSQATMTMTWLPPRSTVR